MARAFLFFAYPADISGDKPWYAVDGLASGIGSIDGLSGATTLQVLQLAVDFARPRWRSADGWLDAFWFVPAPWVRHRHWLVSSVQWSSSPRALAWRTCWVSWSVRGHGALLNGIGSETNPPSPCPFGGTGGGGWAFGLHGHDPVTSAFTERAS